MIRFKRFNDYSEAALSGHITSIVFSLLIISSIILIKSDSFGADTGADAKDKSRFTASIYIKQKVEIAGEKIYLKNISDIDGKTDLKEKAGEINLGAAPRPGRKKKIPGKWIASKIRSQKWITGEIRILFPEYVCVTRAFQTVSIKKLEKIFNNYIVSKIKGKKFKINSFKARGIRKIPLGKVDLKIKNQSRRKIKGRINLLVAVYVNGKKGSKITLSGWIDRYENVVHTNRLIPRNAVLTKKDLYIKSINISKAPDGLVTSIEDAAGKAAKFTIRKGACLKENMLEVPPLIHKGDMVKLVAKTDFLTVLTCGIAKSHGGMGEQIVVENIRSKKIILGRVVDASTVKVLF